MGGLFYNLNSSGAAWTSYGYNAHGVCDIEMWKPAKGLTLGLGGLITATGVTSVHESDVFHPSDMLMVGDAELARAYDGFVGNSNLEGGLGNGISGVLQTETSPYQQRHSETWNCVFADGHVENLTSVQLFDYRRPEILNRWNRDNLPHPELLSRRTRGPR